MQACKRHSFQRPNVEQVRDPELPNHTPVLKGYMASVATTSKRHHAAHTTRAEKCRRLDSGLQTLKHARGLPRTKGRGAPATADIISVSKNMSRENHRHDRFLSAVHEHTICHKAAKLMLDLVLVPSTSCFPRECIRSKKVHSPIKANLQYNAATYVSTQYRCRFPNCSRASKQTSTLHRTCPWLFAATHLLRSMSHNCHRPDTGCAGPRLGLVGRHDGTQLPAV